ncbi:hypothetical protein GIB67_039107 [Kingdonia uniflora]|uniref:DUF4283 domain-containing protein n=1 Tax=Kingdonia uniflora TaxID=39325 RepID=A0A7J7LLD3_9MAGN|nr:hypothetical protein GIB67_039107 [Kingdonia uniflora]
MRIWGGGPWHIEGQLLRVTIWTLDFDINKQKNTHTMVWVKFPGMGTEYWEEDMLMSMARAVGNSVQVDSSTLCRNTGFYASVLVDVDFSKPVPNKIMVEREGFEFCQEIQLGNVPKICSHCKVVGHLVSECRDVEKAIEEVDRETSLVNQSWADMVEAGDGTNPINDEGVKVEDGSGSENISETSSNSDMGYSDEVVYQTQEAEEWDLWKDLSVLGSSNLPWLVVGDFNVVLRGEEQRGGRGVRWNASAEFLDFLNSSSLLEVNSSGSEFTWCNGQMGNKRILSKLDKMLCNQAWSNLFSGWKYKVLA